MKKIIAILAVLALMSFHHKIQHKKQLCHQVKSSYITEITTFKYKPEVNAVDFWKEDAKIQANYTSVQAGFISRESAYSDEKNEVLVIVKWKTKADADASMNKFMTDKSVQSYMQMIDPSTMKMERYENK